MGCLHGRLLHVGANAAAFRLGLPARRRVRRPSRPRGSEGVRPGRPGNGGCLRAKLRRHGQRDPEGWACEQGIPAGARRSGSRSRIATAGPEAVARRGGRLGSGDGPERVAMSDHISGPRALAEPIADITDVYAFPSPERDGWLVLVMNTLPFAQPAQALSDGLLYRFRLRPLAASDNATRAPFVAQEDELQFDCVFSGNGNGRVQEGVCTGPGGVDVRFGVDEEAGDERAGIRSF